MEERLIEFASVLRRNGIRVSLSENMDTFRALEFVGIGDRTLNTKPIDWIRPIEHIYRQPGPRGLFHQVTQGRDIGVEARADILDIKHEGIETFELLRFWPAGFTVERIDRQACLIVFRIRNLLVCVPANSMLGRKERHKLHVASILQNVDRLTSFSIAACVIRH